MRPDWTLIGILAGAAFAGILALIAWLAYRQSQIPTGMWKPVVIGRPRGAGIQHFPEEEERWGRFSNGLEHEHRRRVRLYLYNRSDVHQYIWIDGDKSRVLWPRYKTKLFAEARGIELPPHQGGDTDLIVVHETWGWPSTLDWPKQAYLLRVHGRTRSGHNVRFLGLVRMFPLPKFEDGSWTDVLLKY